MNYLSVENLSKNYGMKKLFNNLSFGINKGEKVGLIAKNGAGKTTLLRILSGNETPDSGEVVFRKDIHVGYLAQQDSFDESKTVEQVLYDAEHPKFKAIKDYNHCVAAHIEGVEMENAFDAMNQHDAWETELKLQQILTQLKVNIPDRLISSLSGGQKKRLALAQVLVNEPEFMILDEPTNHLDLDMIEWLEEFLSKSNTSVLMVTHDRYFLETVCNQIIEMDGGTMYKYTGNFSYYLEKKAERLELEQSTVSKAKNLMRTELEWMRRMPKARGTKSKARQDAFYVLKEKASKRIQQDDLKLEMKMERMGSKIIEFHKVNKAYSSLKILENFSYNFKRGEKLGIVGHNGTGKSTFLNMVAGNAQPDSGTIVLGETVVVGYYRQDGMQLKEDKRIIELVKDIAEFFEMAGGKKLSASQFLDRFLFPSHMQYQYVSTLSGGEKRRLYLLTVLIQNPNFLILDEPTNDLDIFTMTVLEEYLESFQGCLIVVSHDRYFMDKIVDHLFVFKGNATIKDINGSYSIWRAQEDSLTPAQKSAERKLENTPKPSANTNAKAKMTFKEKKEFESLESELASLEIKKTTIEESLSTGNLDNESIIKASGEIAEIIKQIELKTDRWLQLAELEA